MDHQEFRAFVAENADWFCGRLPETDETVKEAVEKLGVSFPPSLKWVLTTHGYWHATGVNSLDEDVSRTLCVRETTRLPHPYIILNDWGDAGVVVIDTNRFDDEGEAPCY